MQLICISRGTFAGGKQLAEKLADKLGYRCLSREEVIDDATRHAIPVGKLEMTVVRRRPLNERLAIDKSRFVAFITERLARATIEGGVVYHGRIGHLVLPNVDHVLRIRAIQDQESRIARTMERLSLSRDKARKYIVEVDEDRRRWGRTLYNVDCEDPNLFDLVVNFDHMTVDNAAAALVSVAALPEFQQTPASARVLENLRLSATCRLAIGDDSRTRNLDVTVSVDGSKATVTHPPGTDEAARAIPEILSSINGVKRVLCTTAATNILWVQEAYDAADPTLGHVLEIAEKWNAAVNLVRLVPSAEPQGEQTPSEDAAEQASEPNGGILDDDPAPDAQDDGGTDMVLDRLIQHGRAGARTMVRGDPQALVKSLDRTANISLVVVGSVFLSKGEAVRKRQTRELSTYLAETMRVPVIGKEELEAEYLFGPRHWVKLIGFFAASAAMFAAVYTHQNEVTAFLTKEGLQHRILAVVALVLFVPTFAYVWGNASQYALRLLKFE